MRCVSHGLIESVEEEFLTCLLVSMSGLVPFNGCARGIVLRDLGDWSKIISKDHLLSSASVVIIGQTGRKIFSD